MRAIIAGAGIGGLTAALALHRRGCDVEVYEAVDEIRPLGVGINLLPHGSQVLHDLGLGPELDATAVSTRAIEYRTKYGHVVTSDPRGTEAGFAYPQYSVHRGHLQLMLLAAATERLGSDHFHPAHPIVAFEQDGARVSAQFGNGASTTGDFLIGADGFHSVVRRQLHPGEGPAHYEGTLLQRGATEHDPFADGRTMFIAGNHDAKFVCYPISEEARRRDRSLINWVAEVRHDQPRPLLDADWTRIGTRDFLDHFDDFSMPDIDIVGLVDATDLVLEYPMVDREPLPWWTDGRVTLLGDAAHPMYPIGANGSSQAILDAVALEQALAGTSSIEAALTGYEEQRREKTTAVVLANRRNGPEQVLDIADARLTGPDDRVEDLITPEEIETVASRYRAVAGFQKVDEQ
jgi:2-polyprenyl-6-methoxyphenol hydroxylase-like FAD-dependent oxidoreductase